MMDATFHYVSYDGLARQVRAKSVPDPQAAADYLSQLVEAPVSWRAI